MSLVDVFEGNLPIIISVPHGGYGRVEGVEVRQNGCREQDLYTLELAEELRKAFSETPFFPFMVVAKISRKICDFNRPAATAFEDERLAPFHTAYHNAISEFIVKAKKLSKERYHGMALLVDLHGQSTMKDKSLRGTRNGSTVTHMIQTFGPAALIGENSVFGHLNNHGFEVFPTTFEEKEHPQYNGGFTVANYGSKDFAEKSLWIDAIQVESGYNFRQDEKSREQFALALRDAILAFFHRFVEVQPMNES